MLLPQKFLRLAPVLTEGILNIQSGLFGKVVQNGDQHSCRLSILSIDEGSLIIHAQRPDGSHLLQGFLFRRGHQERILHRAEVRIIQRILEFGLRLVDLHDRAVQLLHQFLIALGRCKIIGSRRELRHNACIGNRRQRHAGNHVHISIQKCLILGLCGIIIGDFVREILRVQKGDHFAVARLCLFPQAHAENIQIDEILLPETAGSQCIQRRVHRSVAVLRELEHLLCSLVFQKRSHQVCFSLCQIRDGVSYRLISVITRIEHIIHVPAGVFGNFLKIVVIVSRHLSGVADEAHSFLGRKRYPDGSPRLRTPPGCIQRIRIRGSLCGRL